jgi:hypothetical protein
MPDAAYMRAGTASVEVSAARRLARVIADNLEVFLGGGELKSLTRDDGTNALTLSYASRSAQGSDPSSSRWDVVVAMGDGADVLQVQVLDGRGEEVYSSKVHASGKLELTASSAQVIVAELLSLQAARLQLAAQSVELVSQGQTSVTTGGLRVQSLGRAAIQASGNATLSSAGTTTVRGMSGVQVSASGGLLPNPLSNSFRVDAVNGQIVMEAGNPLLGDIGAARSGFQLTTYSGDVRIWSLLGGVSIDTTVPGAVKLGGPPLSLPPAPAIPGALSGTMWEPLFVWAQAFGAAVDAHVHLDPLSGAITTPPLVPIWTSTSALFATARSVFVTFGG